MNAQVPSEEVPPALVAARARARYLFADFLRVNGETRRAQPILDQAIADWREVGDAGKPSLGFVLLSRSRLALFNGDEAIGLECAREALQVYQELNDRIGQASAWRRIGEWAL